MKPTRLLHSSLFAMGSSLLAISSAQAADGSWNVNGSGLWSTTTNWTSGTVADGSGSTASFTIDITAHPVTVNLDSDRTITNLVFSDANTTSGASWIIGNNGNISNNLILAGATPTITVNPLGSGHSATISAIIEGTAGLTKSGNGTLALSGSNTYTGITAINQGILSISHANALGATGVGNGTTIRYTGNPGAGGLLRLTGNITVTEDVTVTGTTSNFQGAIASDSGNNTFAGNITLTGNGAHGNFRLGQIFQTTIFTGNITRGGNHTVSLDLQGNTTVTRPIQLNGGDLTITGSFNGGVTGGGTIILQGVSGSGIGNTSIVQNNILELGITDALNTTGSLTVGGGNDTRGTFQLNGFNQTVNALNGGSGANSTMRIVRNNNATTASTLTVGNGNGTGSFDGIIQNGGAATLSLVKTGSGTQTLSGNSSYTGTTSVNGGALLVNGNNSAASGAVTVASGATLGGNGTIGGTTTIQSGATLAPGSTIGGIGTQTFSGNLTFDTGSIFAWNVASGTSYDQVIVGGSLGGGGNATFNIITSLAYTDVFWNANQTFANVFDESMAGIFSGFSGTGVNSIGHVSGQGTFSITGSSLQWTVIPEPTTALGGLLLAAGLLRRRRK